MDLISENDLDKLRVLATAQDAELKRVTRLMREMAEELARLKGTPVTGELALLDSKLNGTGIKPSKAKSVQRRKRNRRRSEPTKPLPKPVRLFELDEDDLDCDRCGGELREMAGQTEKSELVGLVDISYEITQVERQKYTCRCGAVKTAPEPARTQPGGRYSLDFGVKVAVDKYLNHLPLERQCRMMLSAGLKVGSSTLWNQIDAVARWCEPIWKALSAEALREGLIGLDQTGWPNLDSKNKKKWQMWSITTERIVFHTIRDEKSAATFADLVGEYDGYIVCDDLSTHRAGARGSPNIVLVGCWAHIFRRFEEASTDFPQAVYVMRLIRLLYDIDEHSTEDTKADNRGFWSKLVLDELYRWMTTVPVLTTTNLGKTIQHTLKLKERLWRFVDDPNVWLDNNPTERSIRGPVVGRRNHFGSKSRDGTKAASILYSLVETAKLNGIDPADYLRAVVTNAQILPEVPTMPWELTDP